LSRTYLAPRFAAFGIASPEEFYFQEILAAGRSKSDAVRVLSLGCGAGALEMALAQRLRKSGQAVEFVCLDFNDALMTSARTAATERGLTECIRFDTFDCNAPFAMPGQDVLLVNQFFHHVSALETFCRSLHASLAPGGILLTSDVIGRNGRQLWPAAQKSMDEIWPALPQDKTLDRHSRRREPQFRPVDHAAYSNEGVRAQDVVRCLLTEFDFDLFLTFGGIITPIVARRFGFNFDPDNAEDQALIDRIEAADQAAQKQGLYPPSGMVAKLRAKGSYAAERFNQMSAEEFVAMVDAQIAHASQK
jgi:SAM-dependent methyltransferase